MSLLKKIHRNKFGGFGKKSYLCTRFRKNAAKVDPLAQSVEHNTFNVGVLGSSPKRITEKEVVKTSFFVSYRLDLKKSTISWRHSASNTPPITSALGCMALGAYSW